ncbi:MAG TPA: hypothetical protein VMS88_04430 [Terriglobales bacterium]|nr:hypothetical protein [Terriglobales bacterium]
MRIRALVVAVLALLVLAAPAGATKYAGEFLKIQVGARALGMGGAFVAISDDATAPYWNPAGMVFLPYREVIPQHQEKFGNLANHDYLGGVFPLGGPKGGNAALGLGLIRFAVDDIPITPRPGKLIPGVDFLDYGPDRDPTTPDPGQADGQWESGETLLLNPEDMYMASSSDMAGVFSYARQRGTRLAFGGSIKFVRQSIPDTLPGQHVTSFGAGVDAGLMYMPSDAVTLGAVVHDLTTTYLAWSNGSRELIVPTLDTGAAFTFHPADRHALTWALDLAWGFERRTYDSEFSLGGQTWDVRTGIEYWYRNILALRTGANGKDLTFGAGIRYKQIGVDYAAQLHRFFGANDKQFPDDTNLDLTNLVSASFSW